MRKFLVKTLGLSRDEELIRYFVSKGIFWTNAVKCRPISKSCIEIMRKNCLDVLRVEVELIRPEKIVAAGITARKSVKDLGLERRFNIHFTYHPLYIARFRRDLIKNFVELLEDP